MAETSARRNLPFIKEKMSREPYNYYDEYRRNDEIINDQKEVSDFAKFAKQFQPRYEDEKRYNDYERFFSERQIANTSTSRLCSCGITHTKERAERKIISD